jgi:hypothetical protein
MSKNIPNDLTLWLSYQRRAFLLSVGQDATIARYAANTTQKNLRVFLLRPTPTVPCRQDQTTTSATSSWPINGTPWGSIFFRPGAYRPSLCSVPSLMGLYFVFETIYPIIYAIFWEVFIFPTENVGFT